MTITPNMEKWIRLIEIRGDPLDGMVPAVVETEGRMILSGYAVRFNDPTVIYTANGGQFTELIAPGAFRETDTSKCCLRYNHDKTGLVLARTRGGSLKLWEDEIGLRFEAELFNTSVARDVYEVVKAGGLDGMSFAFFVDKHDPKQVEYDRGTHTRTIRSIPALYDVSVVDNPAYSNTLLEARSFFDAEAEKELAEARERADRIARLEAKIRLGGKLYET